LFIDRTAGPRLGLRLCALVALLPLVCCSAGGGAHPCSPPAVAGSVYARGSVSVLLPSVYICVMVLLLERLAQRALPIISMAALGLAVNGPSRFPTLYVSIALLLHCGLLFQAALSVLGAVAAWRGVVAHSKTDWRARASSLSP